MSLFFSYLLLSAFVLLSASALALSDLRSAAVRSSPSLVSTGLENLGNTCYINAQLQCAFHIPLLRKLVLDGHDDYAIAPSNKAENNDDKYSSKDESDDEMHMNEKNEDIKGAPPHSPNESSAKIAALRAVFSEMIHASGNDLPAISPRNFCLRLGIIPPIMVPQQDSQEFWKLSLLPALVEHASIMELYRGTFESFITALDGSGRERRWEETFLGLSLEVGTFPTLLESLNDRFSQTELLMRSAGNGWRPEKGAATVDAAYKGTSLIARGLPSILQLHLKRFTSYDDAQMARRIKVNDRLVFPVELKLSSICYDAEIDRVNKVNDWLVFPVELNPSSAETTTTTTTTTTTSGSDSTIYDLQSVIVHVGKYGGIGHFYSYIRPDPTSDVWYRFNDDVVEQVTEKEVLQDAYGGRNMINNTGTTAAPTKRGIFSVLARLLRRIGGGFGDPSYGFGGRESIALVVQYVQRSDLHKLYQK